MSVLADVHETLATHLPAGSQLVTAPNAERRFSEAELQQLRAAELNLSDRAVASRVRDFTRGRLAAHMALQQLGERAAEGIGTSASGAPLWPRGVVGSISHCDKAVAAVVAHDTRLQGIGIDVEVEQTLELGIVDAVLRADEARLDPLVQFSAKESMYKLWEPMVGQWLDFAEISVQPRKKRVATRGLSRRLAARRLAGGPLELTFHREVPEAFRGVQGFWVRGAGIVVTAVWIEQP
ncbi:4'-phosphopantetheinyl transferase superfamily protein [uncultured Corynebacterium sp.]|uniref:4'-phosphopantetheinyl transferase family protein n=1 Tax=uncultured Corynebacterium sp. TaxID=159447 RepID=UPI00263330FC|nr:4'-phosphopantetheinyl transferase superfamily protein [uncultured Corynebacterium sp.]